MRNLIIVLLALGLFGCNKEEAAAVDAAVTQASPKKSVFSVWISRELNVKVWLDAEAPKKHSDGWLFETFFMAVTPIDLAGDGLRECGGNTTIEGTEESGTLVIASAYCSAAFQNQHPGIKPLPIGTYQYSRPNAAASVIKACNASDGTCFYLREE